MVFERGATELDFFLPLLPATGSGGGKKSTPSTTWENFLSSGWRKTTRLGGSGGDRCNLDGDLDRRWDRSCSRRPLMLELDDQRYLPEATYVLLLPSISLTMVDTGEANFSRTGLLIRSWFTFVELDIEDREVKLLMPLPPLPLGSLPLLSTASRALPPSLLRGLAEGFFVNLRSTFVERDIEDKEVHMLTPLPVLLSMTLPLIPTGSWSGLTLVRSGTKDFVVSSWSAFVERDDEDIEVRLLIALPLPVPLSTTLPLLPIGSRGGLALFCCDADDFHLLMSSMLPSLLPTLLSTGSRGGFSLLRCGAEGFFVITRSAFEEKDDEDREVRLLLMTLPLRLLLPTLPTDSWALSLWLLCCRAGDLALSSF